MKKRAEWLDISKLVGMFLIYLQHFCGEAGLTYMFAFQFTVPLFFFVSGCTSNYDNEPSLGHFIWSKFKRIMLPFYGFALLSVLISTIANNFSLGEIMDMLCLIAKGCPRNTFFACGLWFLPCLFIMEIAFKLIKKLNNKWIMMVIAMMLFLISDVIIKQNPMGQGHWIFNIDSMMYYIVFYAAGYCAYPYILKIFEFDAKYKRVSCVAAFVISAAYSTFLFEGISICYNVSFNQITKTVTDVIQPLIVIVFILILAKMLEGIHFLSEAGRETLYLCGNEWVVKAIIPSLLSLFGLQIKIHNPLETWLYSFALVFICLKVVIPIEKTIIGAVKHNLAEYIIPNKKTTE